MQPGFSAILRKIPVSFFPVIILTAGYILVAVFLIVFLEHNFLQSDVLGYWQDSLHWRNPFHSFHVPGYPLLIAFLFTITFQLLSPVTVMWVINFIAFTVSVYLVYRLIFAITDNAELALGAALLFGLWPFVGLTYTVVPLADLPSICLFLLGLWYLQRSKMVLAGIFFGLSTITHKAIWLFVFLILLLDFVRRREYVSKRNFILLTLTFLPLAILWLLGSMYHHSMTWIISSNYQVEFASRSGFPVLDGILGSLFEGGIKGILKGMLLVGFAVVGGAALFLSSKRVADFQYWGIAVSLGVLVLFFLLNTHEIWAAARFSRLLVIPLAIGLPKIPSTFPAEKRKGTLVISVLVVLFSTQFLYAWYLARIYFA